MTSEQREARRAYDRKYDASEKGKAAGRRYKASSKGKATRHRHEATPKRIAARAALYVRGREAALVYLGGTCVACGTKEALEFDHIDPKDKSYVIGTRLRRVWEKLVEELDKCQLLCKPCHQKKTNEDRRTGVE